MTSKRARAVERRQVSVLFTDMVGYTAIVEELGEEKALELTQQVYESLTKTGRKHGQFSVSHSIPRARGRMPHV